MSAQKYNPATAAKYTDAITPLKKGGLTTAKGSLRGNSILQHVHFTEFIQIVSAELYYSGSSDMPAGSSEYHQRDDVVESVTDVSLVGSTETKD